MTYPGENDANGNPTTKSATLSDLALDSMSTPASTCHVDHRPVFVYQGTIDWPNDDFDKQHLVVVVPASFVDRMLLNAYWLSKSSTGTLSIHSTRAFIFTISHDNDTSGAYTQSVFTFSGFHMALPTDRSMLKTTMLGKSGGSKSNEFTLSRTYKISSST
jgi:hypothetical protein